MTLEEQDAYCEKYHVKRVERSCGTCKHFERDYDDARGCKRQEQAEFDKDGVEWAHNAGHEPEYGSWGGGVTVDEGYVCDLWEKDGAA